MSQHGRFSFLLVLALAVTLSACATGTTLILLPDADGKVGSASLSTPGETRTVNQAYQSVATRRGAVKIAESGVLKREDIARDYADLLAAEPDRPLAFTLYFDSGSSDLVEQSRAQMAHIVERIKGRLPTEIKVIGHTDTTGADIVNDRLSMRRAQLIGKILAERIPGLGPITVRSFGSKDLLIPTAANVDEPRNRRVEIMIL